MLQRIGSIVLLLPIFLGALWFGGVSMQLLILVLSLSGLFEYARLFHGTDVKLMLKSMYIITTIICVLNFWLDYSYMILAGIVILLILGSFSMIVKKRQLQDIALSILGFVYVTGLFGCIVEIRKDSLHLLWMLLVVVFSTDTFAYLVGISMGRHKLMPAISPKKSVEGAVGGLLGCVVCSAAYGYLWGKHVEFVYPLYFYVGIALVGSVLGQIGDLFASAMKREHGLKDFSQIIPGHGGILDRFDSMLIVAPLIYISPFLYKITHSILLSFQCK